MNQGDKVQIYNKWSRTYDKYVQEEHYWAKKSTTRTKYIPLRKDFKINIQILVVEQDL